MRRRNLFLCLSLPFKIFPLDYSYYPFNWENHIVHNSENGQGRKSAWKNFPQPLRLCSLPTSFGSFCCSLGWDGSMFGSWKCSGRQMEGQGRIRVWPAGCVSTSLLSTMAQSCSGPVFPQSSLQPRPRSKAKGTCLHVRPARLVPVEPLKGPWGRGILHLNNEQS